MDLNRYVSGKLFLIRYMLHFNTHPLWVNITEVGQIIVFNLHHNTKGISCIYINILCFDHDPRLVTKFDFWKLKKICKIFVGFWIYNLNTENMFTIEIEDGWSPLKDYISLELLPTGAWIESHLDPQVCGYCDHLVSCSLTAIQIHSFGFSVIFLSPKSGILSADY